MSRQPFNQAAIAQVNLNLQNGQLKSSLAMGFDVEDIRDLRHPEVLSSLLNTPVQWVQGVVDKDVLKRLIARAKDSEKEIAIIDEMLRREASSEMITDVFGLTPSEVAFRKALLKIDKKQGRWPEIDEKTNHIIWREWKNKVEQYQLDTNNPMDMAKVCLVLANDHKMPMAMIWHSMKEWGGDEAAT